MNASTTPSRQGDLDNLCGIYVLVNAVAYLYPGGIKRKSLKLALLASYSEEWPVQDLLVDGMEGHHIDHLIERVLKTGYYSRYPLKFTKPFARRSPLRISDVLDRIHAYLNGARTPHSRIVLLATKAHWTLVYKVDTTFLYLFDSYGAGKAYRRSYALRAGSATHVLLARETYFIERVEGVPA